MARGRGRQARGACAPALERTPPPRCAPTGTPGGRASPAAWPAWCPSGWCRSRRPAPPSWVWDNLSGVEAQLGAGTQPPDVVAVPPEDDRQGQAAVDESLPRPQEQGQGDEDDEAREAPDERPEGDIPRDRHDRQADGDRQERRRRN